MSEPIKVEQYAWHGFVADELLRQDRPLVEKMLNSDLQAKVRRQGYEPLPGTFTCRFYGADDVLTEPWRFTEEDREMIDRGMVITLTSVRCYRSPDKATA